MGIEGIVFVCLGGLLLLLLLAAAVNAARIKAAPAPNAPVEDEAAALRYAEGLSKMLRVETISAKDEATLAPFYELHKLLETLFPLVHARLERTELSGNLIYRWKSAYPEREAMLLMGHQDVVPAQGEWKHPPFAGVIENGVVYGRGALDCKCTIFAEFSALEELLSEGFEPPCDVYLTTSVDEETFGGGAKRIVEHLKGQGVRLALVLDEGGAVIDEPLAGVKRPYSMIGITEKGYMDVLVKARGAGGHSSTPPKNTPLVRLGRFMAEVERVSPFPRKMSREVRAMLEGLVPSMPFPMRFLLGNLWLFKPLVLLAMPAVSSTAGALLATTCAFTMSEGSQAPNVIPTEARVLANLRVSHHQGMDASLKALEKIAKKHDLTLELVNGREASNRADIGGAMYRYVEACALECFPDAGAAPYVMTGGTDARSYEGICPNCIRFCPVRMTQEQLETVHAANENINAASLAGAVRCYKRILSGADKALS